MIELTARQKQILTHIRQHIEKTGYPPTRADICAAFGFASPNAAEAHLRALKAKGAIEMLPGASRGIRLVAQGSRAVEFSLPVVGRVAAGEPILAVENIEDHHRVDPSLFRPRASFLLRVKGMSMRDAGILNGDLIAVRKRDHALSGQIIVARIDDEVTVKRLRRRGYQVQLVPENPDFSPLEFDMRERAFAIEGIVVGVLRTSV